MAERRSVHRTQWAAQFAVASELCKRGYQVAFTMGNHPAVDLMVISPKGESFSIDVKGLYKRNFWVVSPKEQRHNLFYVFAFVPDRGQNEFFVLDQSTVSRLVQAEFDRARANRIEKGTSLENIERFPCIPWEIVRGYSDKWEETLPP